MMPIKRAFCMGFNLAYKLVASTFSANSVSLKVSIWLPSNTSPTSMPTSLQTFLATKALSPVKTFTLTPCSFNAAKALAAEALAGSKKPMYPISVNSFSSSTV